MRRTILVSATSEAKARPHVAALAATGVAGEEIRVVTPEPGRPYRRLAAQASGLLLAGGPDVEPWRFGEAPMADARLELDPARDEAEMELLAGAAEAATPVWGVCRGLQVINVFLGGSLWQDLPSQRPEPDLHDFADPRDALVHGLRIVDPGQPAAEPLTREAPLVNSRHHQGIKRLAEGLSAVAVAEDGLVEVIAGAAGEWWLRAVQWHPEDLLALAQQRALWAAFAAACRARRAHGVAR